MMHFAKPFFALNLCGSCYYYMHCRRCKLHFQYLLCEDLHKNSSKRRESKCGGIFSKKHWQNLAVFSKGSFPGASVYVLQYFSDRRGSFCHGARRRRERKRVYPRPHTPECMEPTDVQSISQCIGCQYLLTFRLHSHIAMNVPFACFT